MSFTATTQWLASAEQGCSLKVKIKRERARNKSTNSIFYIVFYIIYSILYSILFEYYTVILYRIQRTEIYCMDLLCI